jgi:plasmid stabilization system protein ParE
MGSRRKVVIRESAADTIAAIAWYIESKGMIAAAEKFADEVYDYFISLADNRKSYHICREPSRAIVGHKCISYKKKYTIVFAESDDELIISEFISSKIIYW